jgi:iron complex transport system substrate-binding protein
MQRRLLCVGLLVILAVATAPSVVAQPTAEGCSFPVNMTDATGTTVQLDEQPDRVTTTNPSAAQTMWEIGGWEQVVGHSQYAAYLTDDQRTNVSAEFGVSVERVAGTNPDLVIAPNSSAGDIEGLRNAGLTVYHLSDPTEIEDIRDATRTVGRLTGNCEGAAETNAWMMENVYAVENRTATVSSRKSVLYPLGGGYVAGNSTFINSVINIAGGDNAAGNYTGYPELNDEIIVALDPEVLILNDRTADLVTQAPYAETTAGKNNTTVMLREQDMSQPAPRSVVNSVHNISSQLYPDRDIESVYVPRSTTENATYEQITDRSPTAGNGPGFTVVGGILTMLAVTMLLVHRRK